MKNFIVLYLTSLVFCISTFSSFTVHGGLVSKPTTALKQTHSFIDYSLSSLVSNYAPPLINNNFELEKVDFISTSLGSFEANSLGVSQSSLSNKTLDIPVFSSTETSQPTSPGLFTFILFFLAMAGIASRRWVGEEEQ